MCVYTHIYIHTCTYVYIYVHVYVYMHVKKKYIYIYILYLRIYVYVDTDIDIHTFGANYSSLDTRCMSSCRKLQGAHRGHGAGALVRAVQARREGDVRNPAWTLEYLEVHGS